MKDTVLVFLAPGFEEVEAVAPIDILRRGGLKVKTVAVSDNRLVSGAHEVPYQADLLLSEVSDTEEPLALVFPGGMPGASNLYASKKVVAFAQRQSESKRCIAAICASPGVLLAQAGILDGHKATAYPSFEEYFRESTLHSTEGVVKDGHIITAQGPAFSIPFGLEILKALKGDTVAKEVAEGMLVKL